MDNSTHNARIELAIADLCEQAKRNIRATARKPNLARTTLQDRYKGQSVSRQAQKSEYLQRLTFAQEESLRVFPAPCTARC